MIDDNELQQLLEVWSQSDLTPDTPQTQVAIAHLDDETLYQMVLPSGLAKATEKQRQHLSGCPRCLQEFGEWHAALSSGEQSSTHTNIMTYGLRHAAGSDGPVQPQTLTSTCGRFILGIYPEVDHPKRGMISLDLAKDAQDLHGKTITVRDAKSTLLLDGTLQQGRLARLIDNLDEIDFASWTITEQEPQP